MRAVLPQGTHPAGQGKISQGPTWADCPLFPPDLFAIVGKLVELSGAYHHIRPDSQGSRPASNGSQRSVPVSRADREWASKQAALWHRPPSDPPVPSAVQKEWSELLKAQTEQVFDLSDPKNGSPKWWKIAVRLLMVADEASVGVGFDLVDGRGAGGEEDPPPRSRAIRPAAPEDRRSSRASRATSRARRQACGR